MNSRVDLPKLVFMMMIDGGISDIFFIDADGHILVYYI
jgi:hypothetical protein